MKPEEARMAVELLDRRKALYAALVERPLWVEKDPIWSADGSTVIGYNEVYVALKVGGVLLKLPLPLVQGFLREDLNDVESRLQRLKVDI